MKTKIELEYDHVDPHARDLAERLLNADEAWNALYKIRELVFFHRDEDMENSVQVFDDILEEIAQTRLDKVYT